MAKTTTRNQKQNDQPTKNEKRKMVKGEGQQFSLSIIFYKPIFPGFMMFCGSMAFFIDFMTKWPRPWIRGI